MPGVVDPHVHIDDMFSFDTYETATSAAALGGTTTYIDFAWQPWVGDLSVFDKEGTLLEGIQWKKDKADGAIVDYSLHMAITREEEETFEELEDVVAEGITSFKLFTAYEFGLGNGFMNEAFKSIADVGGAAVLHTE
ncbi:MAG: allantoinase, partial [Halobacteria archaeon]|nr:allantoinase [Halobacteria archaeon]